MKSERDKDFLVALFYLSLIVSKVIKGGKP